MMQGTNLSNSVVIGSQFARADASGAKLQNVDFTDANCYGRWVVGYQRAAFSITFTLLLRSRTLCHRAWISSMPA